MPFTGSPFGNTNVGGGIPGGIDTQVQFNDSGAFGGDSNFIWNKTSKLITLSGSISLTAPSTSTLGVIFKGSDRWMHDFSHPTGGGAVPIGDNVNIGRDAGNFTMGSGALFTYEASYNVNIGVESGNSLQRGFGNLNLGGLAGYSLTDGWVNTNIGYESGYSLTTGNQNVFIGWKAGYAATDAIYNVAIGTNAGLSIVSGFSNTLIGVNSGSSLTGGQRNVCIGHISGQSIQTTSDGVFIGYNAGTDVTGGRNICIGADSAKNLTTGIFNVVIGYDTELPNPTGSNQLKITEMIQGIWDLGQFQLWRESSTAWRQVFEIENVWSNSADATREGRAIFKVSDYAADDGREFFKGEANGSESEISFFGADAQVQQNHIIDADGTLGDITTKFNTLLADLEGYGLLKSA